MKRLLFGLLGSLIIFIGGFEYYIRTPVETGKLDDVSRVLLSSGGSVLELRLNSKGYWRQQVSLRDIDPVLVEALIAYEDARFYGHGGVDMFAAARALKDLVSRGHVVSGASTLTMQLSRLLEPSLGKRTLLTKLHQMAYALKLEHQLSKSEILEAYFTLAPYGGNIEGIKAASYAWLQKSPDSLTMSEAALFVALPQSPEARRPDRNPAEAIVAKNRVLSSISVKLGITQDELDELLLEGLQFTKVTPKSRAPHLFDRLLGSDMDLNAVTSTIDVNTQDQVIAILSSQLGRYKAPVNMAVIIAERETGNVVSYVGSADYLNIARKGGVNYLTALRSPGSTLKPFIYAEALNRNLITVGHVFDDDVFQQDGYAPSNFDNTFSGKISLRDALVRSRNIPAIETLNLIGASDFSSKMIALIGGDAFERDYAGLTMAVGGMYLSAEQLAALYLMLGNNGVPLGLNLTPLVFAKSYEQFFSETTANTIISLLSQRDGGGNLFVAKTGTSHNRQDAWTALLTEKHVILVWLGTPDNEPTEVLVGGRSAQPIALQLAQVLNFKEPDVVELTEETNDVAITITERCGRLINFPEDGSRLISEGISGITVSSKERGTEWYLNGMRVYPRYGNISIPESGFHKITAEFEGCRETVSISVEIKPVDG